MVLYTVIPFTEYQKLIAEGEVSSQFFKAYRCEANKLYRTYAPKFGHFSEKTGMIMSLDVPDERCMISKTGAEPHIEIDKIVYEDVKSADPFLNERFPGRKAWDHIKTIDPAKRMVDRLNALSEEEKKEGVLPTAIILQAGDFVTSKYLKGDVYFDPTEAGNLAFAIKDYLNGEYGEYVKLFYEGETIPALADARIVGRRYFAKQAKAAEKEDRYAAYDLVKMIGIDTTNLHLCPYRGQLDISLRTVGLPSGDHDSNAYYASSNILKDKGTLLLFAIQGALYTLRIREEELAAKRAINASAGGAGDADTFVEAEIIYQGATIAKVRRSAADGWTDLGGNGIKLRDFRVFMARNPET